MCVKAAEQKHNKKAKIPKLLIFNALSNYLYFGASDTKLLQDNERHHWITSETSVSMDSGGLKDFLKHLQTIKTKSSIFGQMLLYCPFLKLYLRSSV